MFKTYWEVEDWFYKQDPVTTHPYASPIQFYNAYKTGEVTLERSEPCPPEK